MKLPYTVRLEPEEINQAKTWASALGLTKSEYVRRLIQRDRVAVVRKAGPALPDEWEGIRTALLASEPLTILLEVLRRAPKLENLRKLAELGNVGYAQVRDSVRTLLREGIIVRDGPGKFEWTYQGVFVLPEYAPINSNPDSVIQGGIAPAFARLLGDYDEFVAFVAANLEYSTPEADVDWR